jgi:hypothetical protein
MATLVVERRLTNASSLPNDVRAFVLHPGNPGTAAPIADPVLEYAIATSAAG